MNDAARHPDDTTLFDLIDGALDDAARTDVEHHLARCAACAAFVAAARVGADAIARNAITMPDDAAERMHVALAGAWRERRAETAAIEEAADAALVSSEIVEVSFAPGTPGTVAEPTTIREPATPLVPRAPRRRARRLVTVLACVVLAALAGTSIYLGEDSSLSPKSTDDPVESAVDASVADSNEAADAAGSVSGGANATASAPPVASTTGAQRGPAASEAAAPAAGTTSSLEDAAKGAVTTPPAAPMLDPVCVATRDEAQIALPDGRPAQQILVGPLGIYLACG